METKRLSFIDALRGFGIFCITLGHANCFMPFKKYLYSFHVPLFFFISGYLFNSKKQPLGAYIKKKTIMLLVPFAAWDILSSVIDLLTKEDFKETMLSMLTVNGQLCFNSPIWFLLVLYIVDILYALIMRLNDKLYVKLTVLLVALICMVLMSHVQLIFKLNLVPYAMIFYSSGNILKDVQQRKPVVIKTAYKVLIAVVLFATGYVVGAYLNERIVYTKAIYGNIALCLVSAFASILFYFILFKNVSFIGNSKLLVYLGKNSLIIMAMQYLVLRPLDYLSVQLFRYHLWVKHNTFKAILLTVFVIAFICGVNELFKYIAKKNKTVQKIGTIFGIR